MESSWSAYTICTSMSESGTDLVRIERASWCGVLVAWRWGSRWRGDGEVGDIGGNGGVPDRRRGGGQLA